MAIDFNLMVGGEAGQGVQSVGFLLAKTFAQGGYQVFADQDYESRIRGGHNFFRVRVRDSRVAAIAEPVHILIALNQETIDLHQGEVAERGVIIYDGEKLKGLTGAHLFSVPLERLAVEKGGNKVMVNTVALAAALEVADYDLAQIEAVLCRHFGAGEVAENNVKAARAGYDYARENFREAFDFHLRPISGAPKRMLLNANEAICLGAVAAGCKFLAAYPMTPSTPILEYLASKAREFGLVVVQPEDEIAAINMAVGAGFAGVRSMTATSGSGFCLMVEGLGLAGITETPVVIIDGQRPGPAVGLPTRTEQGDLLFALHAHQGDFPRVVLAPSSPQDAFWLTVKAFNLAEKYQLPVIMLTDHYLVTSYFTVEPFDLSRVTIDRGVLYQPGMYEGEYQRHKVTPTGISPRAFPGQEGVLVGTDADEHDEAGHLIEDAATRNAQMQKRLRKLDEMRKEVSPPLRYGPEKAELTLVGWGSTCGALQEAVEILRQEGIEANLLHLTELYPFPIEAVKDVLSRSPRSYTVENNATGQLARLIRAETGQSVEGGILKYDGRPFTPAQIVGAVKKEVVYG